MATMRYYRNRANSQWLARVDGNPVITVAEAAAHAAAEYGVTVDVVDVIDGPDPRTGGRLSPPPVAPVADAEYDRIAALATGASTQAEALELIKALTQRALQQGAIRRNE